MDEFDITMNSWASGKAVKFHVILFYESAQVERYRLSAGDKTMDLEKRLLEKRKPWRILTMNFAMKEINNDTVRDLNTIYELIDEVRTGKTKNGFGRFKE